VAASGNYFLAALNNESRELNDYRIRTFELPKYFNVFCSSCYLGLMKPDPEIYLAALNITQKEPSECVFIDDRAQNAESARKCGMHAIHYKDPGQLTEELKNLGIKY
jgi:putative hydrolase of the HAD superfamily